MDAGPFPIFPALPIWYTVRASSRVAVRSFVASSFRMQNCTSQTIGTIVYYSCITTPPLRLRLSAISKGMYTRGALIGKIASTAEI